MSLVVVIYRAVSGCSYTQEPERKVCSGLSGKCTKAQPRDKWSLVSVIAGVK